MGFDSLGRVWLFRPPPQEQIAILLDPDSPELKSRWRFYSDARKAFAAEVKLHGADYQPGWPRNNRSLRPLVVSKNEIWYTDRNDDIHIWRDNKWLKNPGWRNGWRDDRWFTARQPIFDDQGKPFILTCSIEDTGLRWKDEGLVSVEMPDMEYLDWFHRNELPTDYHEGAPQFPDLTYQEGEEVESRLVAWGCYKQLAYYARDRFGGEWIANREAGLVLRYPGVRFQFHYALGGKILRFPLEGTPLHNARVGPLRPDRHGGVFVRIWRGGSQVRWLHLRREAPHFTFQAKAETAENRVRILVTDKTRSDVPAEWICRINGGSWRTGLDHHPIPEGSVKVEVRRRPTDSFLPYTCDDVTLNVEVSGDFGQHLDKLIVQLGDNDYSTRQRARAKLHAVGEAAAPKLREAIHSKDLEVRFSAQKLLEAITSPEEEEMTESPDP